MSLVIVLVASHLGHLASPPIQVELSCHYTDEATKTQDPSELPQSPGWWWQSWEGSTLWQLCLTATQRTRVAGP